MRQTTHQGDKQNGQNRVTVTALNCISSGVFTFLLNMSWLNENEDHVSPVTGTEMVEKRGTVVPMLCQH